MVKSTSAATAAADPRALYPEGVDVPSVGVSIACNLGGDRQMTVQTFYPVGSDLALVNALIDQLMVPIDRQKAFAELIDLEAEHEKLSSTLRQLNEDYARLEVDFHDNQARRAVQLEEIATTKAEELAKAEQAAAKVLAEARELRDTEYKAGYSEHTTQGRRGEYAPAGARAANLKRMDEGAAQLEKQNRKAIDNLAADYDQLAKDKQAEIDAAVAERGQFAQQIGINIKRHTEEVAIRAAKIAARKALI